MSDYGVNDLARASSAGFSDRSLLVPGGAVRGFYLASSGDGSWMAFQMPDGSVRWELNGVPATPTEPRMRRGARPVRPALPSWRSRAS